MLAFLGGLFIGSFLTFVLTKNSRQKVYTQRQYYDEEDEDDDEEGEDDEGEGDELNHIPSQRHQMPPNKHGAIPVDDNEIRGWLKGNPDLRQANKL